MKTTIQILQGAFLAVLMLANTTAFAGNGDSKKKKGVKFTVERTIPASADKVWAVVGEDYGAIANSHPTIVSSNYVNGSLKSGEGAERVCNLNEKGTKYVQEKQVDYDPDNYTFKAAIYHVNGLPLEPDPDVNYGIYKVVPVDDNSCKLVMELSIRTSPAFMGKMAKGKFKKTISDYTLAVHHHVVTGEIVNKDNFKEIKKQYKS